MTATATAPADRPAAAGGRRVVTKAALWDYAHLAVLATFALGVVPAPLIDLTRDASQFVR